MKLGDLNCRNTYRHQLFNNSSVNRIYTLDERWKNVKGIINNVSDVVIVKERKTKKECRNQWHNDPENAEKERKYRVLGYAKKK